MGRMAFLSSLLMVLPLAAQPTRLGAGHIASQYAGRVTVDFTKGTGIVYGNVTQFTDVPFEFLFSGVPIESTAVLTFVAEMAIQPLPGKWGAGSQQLRRPSQFRGSGHLPPVSSPLA